MSIENKNLKTALRESREKSPKRKFCQSIDLIINLRDIDMKKPEGKIQQKVELPHKVGKKVNVCVIANSDIALRARKAGADLVLESSDMEGLIKDRKRQRQIAKSMDAFIASSPLMPLVGRALGGILGPRGKMPTPIPPTANIEKEIERHRRLKFVRARGQPVLQCQIGTEDMSDTLIAENIQAIMNSITRKLKRGIKNIAAIYVKTSMGKPVKVNL